MCIDPLGRFEHRALGNTSGHTQRFKDSRCLLVGHQYSEFGTLGEVRGERSNTCSKREYVHIPVAAAVHAVDEPGLGRGQNFILQCLAGEPRYGIALVCAYCLEQDRVGLLTELGD